MIEAQTVAIAPKCVASTVGLVINAENEDEGGSGSGVIVSADGLILTVGHVTEKPGVPISVRFSDGRIAKGVALGLDRDADTGMARITDPAPADGWPFAPVAPADSAHLGDWVLALGHAGSIVVDRSPPIRLGRVTSLGGKELKTNCAIEPGDSGGPLFDLSGRVVGLAR